MKVTFFPGSIIGYVDHPQAILTRGLALGLVGRGHDVRIVEERQNAIVKRTLLDQGAEPTRHFHRHFQQFQYHTFEPRTGAPLLEWVTRELALIDVAVAVDGVEQELCRWLGNVTREGLLRVFATYDPDSLTDERAAALEIEKFDLVVAPSRPAGTMPWSELPPAVAEADEEPVIQAQIPPAVRQAEIEPDRAAAQFEQIIDILRR